MVSTSQFYDPNYRPQMKPARGQGLLTLAQIIFVAETLCLLLRLWSRAVLPGRNRFQADDWTAVAAWPFCIGIPVVAMYTLNHGFGNHVNEVPLGNLQADLKALFVGIICFYTGVTLVRISASLFYRRVLGSHGPAFGRFVWANIVINIVFLIAMVPIIVTTCDPVPAFWDRTIPNHKCRSAAELMNSAGVTAAVLDVITLVLPLPIITRLRLSWQKKLLVCGVFILGYSVVVFSIGRAVTMYRLGTELDTDVTWSLVAAKYWVDLEIAFAFIGICIPSMFALGKRAANFGWSSLFNNRDYSRRPSAVNKGNNFLHSTADSEMTYVDTGDGQLNDVSGFGKADETVPWTVVVKEV